MGRMKKNQELPFDTPVSVRTTPAIDSEAHENQMIAYAMNLAEQRLLNGTASSQEVVFYLKLGCSRDKMEKEKMKKETELMEAKRQNLEAVQRIEAMYASAMEAFRAYSGDDDD